MSSQHFAALVNTLTRPLLEGGFLTQAQQQTLMDVLPHAVGRDLDLLSQAADAVRLARVGRTTALCAIINAKSGRCGEDCAFCAQSGRYNTHTPEHAFVDPDRIVAAATAMAKAGVARFAIVTSGRGLEPADLKRAKQAIAGIAALGMAADASLGIIPKEILAELRQAGLAAYHHNLETSRAFYPKICTTRTYDDNLSVLIHCRELGIPLCSGGLFGVGEGWEDRLELARTLLELGAFSIPVNFLRPVAGTPLGDRPVLETDEARRIIIFLRLLLPDRQIRICGGRPTVFGATDPLAPMTTGADSLMVGNYLTTGGMALETDISGLTNLGFSLPQRPNKPE